ncbi:hypothetical protein [Vibrio alginolyticus]|uniref:hypothetical protein n=1 Tax=Vibrio alginolyticus TaxID=663 RepID=UPI00215CABC0|nr:hypothetical protein [Vibrio alginolyticus]EJI1384880.1 hypothetical protein [Vibrio alginolyticus]MCR9537646.1 hypothetical protein [Vibrio alginolyticus]
MKNWFDIKSCQDNILDELNLVYKDFCLILQNSKHVTVEDEKILIDYLSYRFESNYRVIFVNSKAKIRIKFETISIDGEKLFFDILLDRSGIINTEYSHELDGYCIDIMKNQNIENNLAKLMYGFFDKNDLLGS